MPIDPVSQTLWGVIEKEARRENEKRRKSGYWIKCPSCGKRVVKKELIKKGCYACGWKGTKEEIELAQAKQRTQASSTAPLIKREDVHSYWTNCPKCGRRVVREELKRKGCFICGYKPEAEVK